MRIAQKHYNIPFILGKKPEPLAGVDDLMVKIADNILLCVDQFQSIDVMGTDGEPISIDSITIEDVLAIRRYLIKVQ